MTTVEVIYAPSERELMLFKRCIWVTMGRTDEPKTLPSSELLRAVIRARHSPLRVLNYAFLIREIPSNISTHLARHVHAVSFVSSLRNDRQERMDGDNAPRNTPVDMIFYCNAEELQIVANKRLCGMASRKTRRVVKMMCRAAEKVTPELKGCLVPMCEYCGGVCYELKPCARQRAREASSGALGGSAMENKGKRAAARRKYTESRERYVRLAERGNGDADN